MGVVQRLTRGSGLSNPNKSLLQALLDMPFGAPGITVTEKSALASTAVMACIRVISEDLASLPLQVFQKQAKGRNVAETHPLYPVLHHKANPMMTSFTLRETMQAHILSWGNGYAEIESDGAGDVRALWPLRPDRTKAYVVQGTRDQVVYFTYDPVSQSNVPLPADRVLHIPGLGFDGLSGYSPIKLHKDAISLALAAEKYAGKFYSNGAQPAGVLTTKEELSPEAHKRLKREWKEMHQGLDNAQRVAILEEGMDFKAVGMPLEEAQFIETRKYQTTDIARIYLVPPHRIGDLEKATFSNIEHQQLQYVIHTLRPWLVRWEQAMLVKLFTASEQVAYFAEFNVDGLLRGDSLSRQQSLEVKRRNGVINADEWRELENMNPLPGGQGKYYLVPLNMGTIDNVAEPPEPAPAPAPAANSKRSALARKRLTGAYRHILTETWRRIVRAEHDAVLAAADRYLARHGRDQFEQWSDSYYAKHRDWAGKLLAPLMNAMAEAIREEAATEVSLDPKVTEDYERAVSAYTDAVAKEHVDVSCAQVKMTARLSADPVASLNAMFKEWDDQRVGAIVNRELTRSCAAFSVATYREAGVWWLRWKAYGTATCEQCAKADGKLARIDGLFYTEAEAGRDVPIPPLHDGCSCAVEASWLAPKEA